MDKKIQFSMDIGALKLHSGALEACLSKALLSFSAINQPAIVIDPFFKKSLFLDEVCSSLAEVCSQPAHVIVIEPAEPTLGSIGSVRDELAAISPDVIIALGGGSAIDTAKIARMSLSNDNALAELSGPNINMVPHRSAFLAIPSTAGTGSEVTEVAVASSEDGSYKLPFRSSHMAASTVILDPAIGYSAPLPIRAASGYDAITHAVEAYVSRLANPITDALCLGALDLLVRHLPKACCPDPDLSSFNHCLIAAAMAGLAFNSAQLGLAHAISSPLGGNDWKVPHGLGNALCLPSVMQFNASVIGEKEEVLAGILNSKTSAEGLEAMKQKLGLTQRLGDWIRSESDIKKLAEGSMKSGQVKNNPRAATINDIEQILHGAL